tara:strand:- start:1203 stop:2387 length:1185 start_codon:yes stop_codon:yes gene_type:complete
MIEKISHSFEAGRRGKPDELDSGIAHLIGAHLLELDQNARFDLRVSGTYRDNQPLVRVSGEVSDFSLQVPNIEGDISRIVLDRYNFVHRTELRPEQILFNFSFKPQSHSLASNGNSGDSGNPIAVAYKDAPNHLPFERYIAVAIRDILDTIYHKGGVVPEGLVGISGISELRGLKADGKVSVEALYAGSNLDSLAQITLAVEHEQSLSIDELREKANKIIVAYLDKLGEETGQSLRNPEININGAGAWNKGGWEVDEGSREAKPYRDGFASYGVQEDSFSGEDPTKPSGTGTFLARYIAVQLVGNSLADFARVALSYTIGKEDVGLNIVTNGTSSLSQVNLEKVVRTQIPLGIKDTIQTFNLRNPDLYKQIVSDSDYFHSPELPWNSVRTLNAR